MPDKREELIIETEKSVLGSMMLEPEALEKGVKMLTVADFYRPVNQAIFEALAGLLEQDEPVDLLTLQEELRTLGRLEDCGGTEYLMSLVDAVPTAANIAHYARIVKAESTKRQLAAISLKVTEKLKNGEPVGDVMAWMDSERSKLSVTGNSGLRKLSDTLYDHLERLSNLAAIEGLPGYTTGFSRLDNVTGGFGMPLFAILKAPRGSGKTHHMISASVNCIRANKTAVIFSLDTPEFLMNNRYLAHNAGINSFKCMKLTAENDWASIGEAAGWYFDNPLLYIYSRAGVTVREMAAMCRTLANDEGHDIGFIGIDFAEKVGVSKSYGNREQELSGIGSDLSNLRDEFDTTIYLLSQVNDEGGERNSRGLGNECDLLMQWQVDHSHNGKGTGKLITEKNRLGSDVMIRCEFDWGTSRIMESEMLEPEYAIYPPQRPWWYDETKDPENQFINPFDK
jgi:replicative DNA helicase